MQDEYQNHVKYLHIREKSQEEHQKGKTNYLHFTWRLVWVLLDYKNVKITRKV